MPLTQTETWYLSECIKGETLMCQKLASYANQVQDPQLRNLVNDLQRTCQRHVDMLTNHIR
ncbi:MAG TPA: spore coat protein [Firmicutes bacterium]|nr:spore coat protein [Candidatus Fermentithermobacillaceae bacterium]